MSKQSNFGKPIHITIRGHGHASGKTQLQLILAQFLCERGHAVSVSDYEASDRIMAGWMHAGPIVPNLSNPVHLHVSGEPIKIHPELPARSVLQWTKLTPEVCPKPRG